MIARASVAAAGDRLVRLRSQAPLALRQTPGAVYLIGAAAGPLGGDKLSIDIDVAEGATLVLRTAAASVVLPGLLPSVLGVRARVASGASLVWHPQPTVLARGCRHHVDGVVTLERGARLEWWDDLVLGRYGEPGGSVLSRLSIDIEGRPLVRHEIALGPDHPASQTPAVAGSARAMGSVVVVGRGSPPAATMLPSGAAAMPLDGPAVHVISVGRVACESDVEAVRAAVHG